MSRDIEDYERLTARRKRAFASVIVFMMIVLIGTILASMNDYGLLG